MKIFDYKFIKTFEDACKDQDIDSACLPNVLTFPMEHRKSILAYCKLIIIYKAINRNWKADYTDNSQKKHWPYFVVKKASGGRSIRFSSSDFSYDVTGTIIGGRLCTNSKEKADYIGTQFIDLYKDFLMFPNEEMLKIDMFLEQITPTSQEKIEHLKWMIENLPPKSDISLNDGKRDRWIGFAQGVLWAMNIKTIDELRDETRNNNALKNIIQTLSKL